ncbi:MAG: hypothetical protein NT167_28375 [Verrucomicrobia bacterium]|nr:hypothetical protein [Verrucomicrobiota bacterium]
MRMPNAHLAVADQDKIAHYLLNAAHPDNGGKAPFFLALGFRPDDWQSLAAALPSWPQLRLQKRWNPLTD